MNTKLIANGLKAMCAVVLALGISACKSDDKIDTGTPFDPAKPLIVSGFTPESGGYQEQIIVKGSNFGNDKSVVTLTIGGREAAVVNVRTDMIYGFVPSGAFSGEVEVTVKARDGRTYSAQAPDKFIYERKDVVGTLCGYQNENDSQGELWGSFDICSGFRAEGCMTFDPLYPNRLYIAYDQGEGFLAQLDLEKREASVLMSASKFGLKRIRNIDFALDGKYMLVSTDRDDNNQKSTSVWIVTRNADGTFSDRSSCQVLAAYRQCNGVAVHPVNGEIYFNSYEGGQLFRLDLNDYLATLAPSEGDGETKQWTGYLEDKAFRELFKIQDPSYEFQVTIHPTGKYAYLTVINKDYILRTDYDDVKKEFTTPYTVVGANSKGEWVDAVGTNARVHRPYQGVFVKNPKYEEEGREDVYDYYFADCLNFCVRYFTPDGLVRTYAGRAPSTNGNIWGTEDGDLRQAARFRDVTGLAYDKNREMFYVLDHNNRRVRYIGKEMEQSAPIAPVDPEETEESEE